MAKASDWTAERRAKQSDAIRRWRPWEQSTGPRSAEGKTSASRNADKGGQRKALREEVRELRAMMAEQGEALNAVQIALSAGLVPPD